MDYSEHISNLSMIGGALCLDFINTVDNYESVTSINYLSTQKSWVCWLGRQGFEVPPYELQFDADRILQVRTLLRQLFIRLVEEDYIEPEIDQFNKELSEMWQYTVINKKKTERRLEIDWNFDKRQLDHYLWPIIKSAYDLMITPQMKSVKSCPNCGWMFLDQSKNKSRKWCDMKSCGNTSKTRKYYQKKKKHDLNDK